MRDLVLLVVVGTLLGFLGATTLVVVREGGEHAGRIARGELPDAPAQEDAPDTAAADSMAPAVADVATAVAPADSATAAGLESPETGPAAPTASDDRGTPLQEGEAAAVVSAAALPATLPTGPMPGPEDLARYLSTMQPRDAARVLEQMTDAEIARILAMIGGRRASAIMGSLAPDRAAAIGRLALANQKEEVS